MFFKKLVNEENFYRYTLQILLFQVKLFMSATFLGVKGITYKYKNKKIIERRLSDKFKTFWSQCYNG